MTKTATQKNIPEGWDIASIADVTENLDNRRKPVTKSERKSGSIPYYGATGIVDYVADYLFDEPLLLVGEDGADWSKHANTAYLVDGKSWVNNHAHVLRCTRASRVFLKEYLNYQDLNNFVTGGTRGKLTKGDLGKISITLPPEPEQERIAEILSTVDEEIQKTDEVIAAAEKLRRGLMQRLFTRGIGHTKFKKAEIGEIPEEWGASTIKESSIELIDGDRGVNYPKLKDFSPEGFCLFLSAKNVTKNGFIFNEASFITKEKDSALRKGKLQRGDVVLTSRGTVGNVAYYDEGAPYGNVRINSGMLIIRHGKQFNPVFLYQYFSGPQMRKMYLSMGSGSAQPQLPIRSLEQIRIPIIPLTEQGKISEIIRSVNVKIAVSKQIKEKLSALKKGLMQDLLSGRIRIKI